eukprot:SM000350S13033  [mRNA]  locus=s350:72796:76967:- [translate_table: standard]
MEAGGQPAAGQGSTPRPLPLMLGARYHSSVAAAFRAACLLIPTRAAVLEDLGASMPPAAPRFEQLQVAQQHLLHLLIHHLPPEPSAGTLPPLVGLHLPPSAVYLVALLAALEVGAAFVPLDPALPLGRLHAIAADAQLAVIVTQDATPGMGEHNTHVDLKLTLSDVVPGACIDASPVLVYHHLGWRILVGSHAHTFVCASASSSHDKHVYVLRQPPQASCMWRHKCPGSVFASPALDEVRRLVYVATTSGHVLALAGDEPFHVRWSYTAHSPIFGVPAVDKDSGLVVLGAVDGSMTGISSGGAPLWKASAHIALAYTSHPLAAPPALLIHPHNNLKLDKWRLVATTTAACLLSLLLVAPSLLACVPLSRSQDSACSIKEALEPVLFKTHRLLNNVYHATGTLAKMYVCGCSTAGDVQVFVAPTATGSAPSSKLQGRPHATAVEQQSQPAAALLYKMPGEVFSSPVMLGGHIYVGCRDDYLYCLELRPWGPAEAA